MEPIVIRFQFVVGQAVSDVHAIAFLQDILFTPYLRFNELHDDSARQLLI